MASPRPVSDETFSRAMFTLIGVSYAAVFLISLPVLLAITSMVARTHPRLNSLLSPTLTGWTWGSEHRWWLLAAIFVIAAIPARTLRAAHRADQAMPTA